VSSFFIACKRSLGVVSRGIRYPDLDIIQYLCTTTLIILVAQSMYLIRQKNTNTYYSDILDNRHCIYGFRHRIHAVKCTNFLSTYKKRYKRYPSVEQVMFSTKFVGSTDPICIDKESIEDMKIRCVVNGLHLFEVYEFDSMTIENRDEVIIRGKNVTLEEAFEVSQEHLCAHLENILELE